jgi:hypothetical protein
VSCVHNWYAEKLNVRITKAQARDKHMEPWQYMHVTIRVFPFICAFLTCWFASNFINICVFCRWFLGTWVPTWNATRWWWITGQATSSRRSTRRQRSIERWWMVDHTGSLPLEVYMRRQVSTTIVYSCFQRYSLLRTSPSLIFMLEDVEVEIG